MPRNNQGKTMRDPDFFLHRYAPTTNLMAFLEVPYDKLVDCIAQWERRRDKYREVVAACEKSPRSAAINRF